MGSRKRKYEGTIWKHGNRIIACYYWKGKQHRDSYLTEEEAEQRLIQVTMDKKRKKEPRSQNIMVDRLLSDYVSDLRKRKKRSVADARSRIDLHLDPFFKGMRVAQCNGATIEEYISDRLKADEKPEAATINREVAILRASFFLARKNDLIDSMPVFNGRMLPEPKAITRSFSDGEFETFRSFLPEDCKAACDFGYQVGWRLPTEVLTMQWGINVDFDQEICMLPPNSTKDNSDEWRIFVFTNRMREILNEQRSRVSRLEKKLRRIIAYVFVTDDGEPLFEPYTDREGLQHIKASHYFRTQWDSACTQAKIVNTPHDFRRSAAIRRDMAGLSIHDNMVLAGWRSPVMLTRYLEGKAKKKENLIRAVEKLDKFQESSQKQSQITTFRTGQKRGNR